MRNVKAAILRDLQQPLAIEEVELADLQAQEVLVKIVASGVCHTDYSAPGVLTPLPVIPGHEGAGIIEAVGGEVTDLEVGDHVLMSFGSCGGCPACSDHHPHDCQSWPQINFGGQRLSGGSVIESEGGEIAGSFFQQSSFATHAIATERNVVKVDKDLPLTTLAPLGCGFITGAGAVMNALKPERGSSIVVFGVGAVGMAAVMAAVIQQCETIIVVDLLDERLEMARQLGATHVINPARGESAVEVVHKLTAGGANYSVETAGVPATFAVAVECLRAGGVCGLLTVPNGGQPFEYSALPLLFGRTIKGIIEGACDPQQFIPQLIELFKAGQFPLDKLIEFYPFEAVNQAMEDSKSGKTIKAVLLMS